MPSAAMLPYGRQCIEDDDVAEVVRSLRSDLLTTGPQVQAYEAAFAEAVGATHAVACNSGTAALHLAVLAAGIGPGDAAVVPSMTFVATANVIRMTGAEVVFADVDPETGLMTPETFEQALQKSPGRLRTRVAVPVHLNGQLCDMAGLSAVAARKGLEIIEDACHALGAVEVGATKYSNAACFSTHPVKAIATGEGGVVTTADAMRAARMRRLCSHGISRDRGSFANRDLAFAEGEANPWYYEMQEIGWNYRMPDILCALGMSQLAKLDRFLRRRKEIAALYERLLAPLSPYLRPVARADSIHGWHLYALRVDFAAIGMTRARLMESLRRRGIGTQVHYIPVHLQPYYRHQYPEVSLPGAEAYYARCLSIPFYPLMTDADVERVADCLSSLIRSGASGHILANS